MRQAIALSITVTLITTTWLLSQERRRQNAREPRQPQQGAFQQVFTTLFFLDEVMICDMVDDGSKLIGLISQSGAFGKAPRIIEKISEIDGVLAVQAADIITLTDM